MLSSFRASFSETQDFLSTNRLTAMLLCFCAGILSLGLAYPRIRREVSIRHSVDIATVGL